MKKLQNLETRMNFINNCGKQQKFPHNITERKKKKHKFYKIVRKKRKKFCEKNTKRIHQRIEEKKC